MISGSYDFQAHQQRSHRRCCFSRLLYCDCGCSQTCRRRSLACRRRSQACRRRSQVLPGAPKVLSGAPRCSQTYHKHSHGSPVPVIRDPTYSAGRPECPPRVWYSPEIDASKFTLHILSDTPGGSQWLQYIFLVTWRPRSSELRVALGDSDRARFEMHLEPKIELSERYTWRP